MSQKNTVLLVRTQTDEATKVAYGWAETVKQRFEAKGWQVLDIALDKAVRSKVEKALKNSDHALFLFYGHGEPDSMIGQDNKPVLDLKNLSLLKAAKVYVVACWTAKQLGPAAQSITRCYLGYKNTVEIWLTPSYIEHLGKCVNKGILEMLNLSDCSIEQARQHIMDEYSHWIDHYSKGKGSSSPLSVLFAADLRHNRDALAQVFGDISAKLIDIKPE